MTVFLDPPLFVDSSARSLAFVENTSLYIDTSSIEAIDEPMIGASTSVSGVISMNETATQMNGGVSSSGISMQATEMTHIMQNEQQHMVNGQTGSGMSNGDQSNEKFNDNEAAIGVGAKHSSVPTNSCITTKSQQQPPSSGSGHSGSSNSGGGSTANGSNGGKPMQRKRARATSEQVAILESVFQVNRSPPSRMREDLAARLGMMPRQVQVWFQNRRAKEKTQQRNPRPLAHHPNGILEQLAYAPIPPEMYAVAMAQGLIPNGADPSAGVAVGGYIGNAAFGSGVPVGFSQAQVQGPAQQRQMADGQQQMALAAAAAAAAANSQGQWASWGIDASGRQQNGPGICVQQDNEFVGGQQAFPVSGVATIPSTPFSPTFNIGPGAMTTLPLTTTQFAPSDGVAISQQASTQFKEDPSVDGQGIGETQGSPPAASSALSTTVHTPVSGATSEHEVTMTAPLNTTNTDGNRRESEGSGVTAVPSPTGTTLGMRIGNARRPAPLTLVPNSNAFSGALVSPANVGIPVGLPVGLGLGFGMGYAPFIPEMASYMVLDAILLTVGAWQRVQMQDTELTCLACVEPPPLKPVQRPGNHRPAEIDSLVGEFQWIISNCGMRYKMVIPYSTISRIKFRETPDPSVALGDGAGGDQTVNPQTALSLLNRALQNPQARGELSIHTYDLPRFYLQSGVGWKRIEDFSENRTASNTKAHIVTGPFASLFCQLRILLATCSRLKIAADTMMSIWLGSMDDPYGMMAGTPHNTWIPCSDSVYLHTNQTDKPQTETDDDSSARSTGSTKIGSDEPTPSVSGAPDSMQLSVPDNVELKDAQNTPFAQFTPSSAGTTSTDTLAVTPGLVIGHPFVPARNITSPPATARPTMFSMGEQPQPNMCSAAMQMQMAGLAVQPPMKTQRSASLPFIRPMANIGASNAVQHAVPAVQQELHKQQYNKQQLAGISATPTPEIVAAPYLGEPSPVSGLRVGAVHPAGHTPPHSASLLPLRHRTSSSHLRRTAPYQVSNPPGSSPQASPQQYWFAQSMRRTSRESLNGSLARRESDTELAMAMNHTFTTGDVLGNTVAAGILPLVHQSLMLRQPGLTGCVPPSPLSHVTTSNTSANESAKDGEMDGAADLSCSSSASESESRTTGSDMPLSAVTTQGFAPSLSLPAFCDDAMRANLAAAAAGQQVGVANNEMMMALLCAMNNAAKGTPANYELGFTAPDALFAANKESTMDLGFDWSQQLCGGAQSGIMQTFLTAEADGAMNIDWTSCADEGAQNAHFVREDGSADAPMEDVSERQPARGAAATTT